MFCCFFFGLVRSLREFSLDEIPNLLKLFADNFEYVPSAHQIYFGTPYQITPLIYTDYQLQGNTLLSSILFSIPLVGKGFRLTSGVSVYNQAIYGSSISSDQVIPVAGEFDYNFGLIGVLISHLMIGYFYCKIDKAFKQSLPYSKAIAAAWFYLAIHYNAAIFLSISVLIQFLVYSCLPAIILLITCKYQLEETKLELES